MECLACRHNATGKMRRILTIVIDGVEYNLYQCNVCNNEVLIPASSDS